MDDAAKMYELQKVDLTWAKVRRRLMEIQKLLGESEELQKARAKVEKSEAQLKEYQAKQQDSELESRTLVQRIKDADDQLMSGAINNPKELEALQASAESLRRQLATAEDTAVTVMMSADDTRVRLEKERELVAELEEVWSSGQDSLKAEENKMRQHYLALKRKRESVAATLGDSLLEKYETMRRRRGGIAVAPVRGEECGACHVALPTGVISSMQSNRDELVICTSCGRYLVQL